jgi:uncharacterized protein (TIGR03790 family)
VKDSGVRRRCGWPPCGGRVVWTVLALAGAWFWPVHAADSGASVVVVYNSRVPESKAVAEHYAQRRQVPTNQVLGFDLPVTETLTRAEFIGRLQAPLFRELAARKLFTLAPSSAPATNPPSAQARKVVEAKIRYAALCYGVPLKILRDATLVEEGTDKLPPEYQRNEAAVDSQLCLLPVSEQKLMWAGPLPNPFYGTTNDSLQHPTNGLLMVTRLDGPTPEIARGLVDKALEAETNGLWGRAYFDARGLRAGDYKPGDDWIRGAAELARRYGLETELDDLPATWPSSFPMSQIALYAGWYDDHASGPFTRRDVEFMPGAIAYHLHSFSANTIRSTSAHWVGPLLNKGATVTMGCVEEPYLTGTPELTVFFVHLFLGSSLGEAAYAASPSLSWQTTVVGDPLYRPFARRPDALHADLEQRKNPIVEWSHLRVVNLSLVAGRPPEELLDYLDQIPWTRQSAVLTEKQAELYLLKKNRLEALRLYERALHLHPSPQQKVRLFLALAENYTTAGSTQAAFDTWERFLKEVSDYPDPGRIYQQLLPLAQTLGRKEDAARYEREIKRLPPAPKAH